MAYAHELRKGDSYEPLEFVATPEMNEYFLYALGIFHPRYLDGAPGQRPQVHPVILLHHSPRTRSPSFRLAPGMGSVFARDHAEFLAPAFVGSTFRVTWEITDVYEKRGRTYQNYRAEVAYDAGQIVLRRDMSSIFSRPAA